MEQLRKQGMSLQGAVEISNREYIKDELNKVRERACTEPDLPTQSFFDLIDLIQLSLDADVL